MSWDKAEIKPLPGEGVASAGEFRSFADRVVEEHADRMARKGSVLSFGVKFLDLALGGILKNDLILIGAKTGAGKTALATRIAFVNAFAKRRVHYFALEAEDAEIERRIKYGFIVKLAAKSLGDRETWGFNFMDWYMGRLEDRLGRFEQTASNELAAAFGTLHTFYRTADFYAEHFEQMVRDIQSETDLIILDHLHYVDSEDPNDNRGYKLITKKIRDVALKIGKPVVVVAHLRKADRKGAPIVPGIEDFHGTSDVPKIATKAIIIAPAFDQPSPSSLVWPTYLSPAKCRFEGSRTRYIGCVGFDVRMGTYSDSFTLGRLSVGGDSFTEVLAEEIPKWAERR